MKRTKKRSVNAKRPSSKRPVKARTRLGFEKKRVRRPQNRFIVLRVNGNAKVPKTLPSDWWDTAQFPGGFIHSRSEWFTAKVPAVKLAHKWDAAGDRVIVVDDANDVIEDIGAVRRALHVAERMSNLLYNLMQSPERVPLETDRRSMDELVKEWDSEARR